jgi:uncharacterized protein YbjT (DUF2867 family)
MKMRILVAGSTGRVGGQLVDQLVKAGHEVRALTRHPEKAVFPEGVEVFGGDLTRPESLTAAMQGITGLHLINFGGDNYESLQTGHEIVAMAEKAGVSRVTVLRGGAETELERAVQSSTLAWTFLNPVEFMSNILGWADSIRAEGLVRQPFGDRKTAIVHEADIAAVAASALTEEGHGGKSYTITGPEVLTPRALTQIIGATIGRDIQFAELTEAEAQAQWSAAGIPPQIIDFLLFVYGNTPEIGYTVVPTVENITKHPPRRFEQWVKEHMDVFLPI